MSQYLLFEETKRLEVKRPGDKQPAGVDATTTAFYVDELGVLLLRFRAYTGYPVTFTKEPDRLLLEGDRALAIRTAIQAADAWMVQVQAEAIAQAAAFDGIPF